MGRPPRTTADRALMVKAGERLRWVREVYGLSQAEMAVMVGDITQTAWSLYERGERFPDEFRGMRLIAKLRISREYLLEGTLQGVERELAIQLAARHPELAGPIDTAPGKDRDPP